MNRTCATWPLLAALIAGCAAVDEGGYPMTAPAPGYDMDVERAVGATPSEPMASGELAMKAGDEEAPPPRPGGGAGADGGGGANGGAAPDGQGPGGQVGGDAGQGGAQAQPPPPGPLLIYRAELTLAVHEVESTQRAVIAVGRELGGYLAYQDDTRVTIRVPARRFEDAVDRLERVGDVVHRNVQAIDVTEEFRDLTLRLRNAEVVRDRLEALLARAEKVEDALKVQAELARVTELIEQLKGRLRYLQDRIAYSTITVIFQPRPVDRIGEPDVYRLPFRWLDELGLPALLNLR